MFAIINDPDYIVVDGKHESTVFIIRHIEDATNMNVVVRLNVENENPNYKNSIMTAYRIREKNLLKLIERNEIIFYNSSK